MENYIYVSMLVYVFINICQGQETVYVPLGSTYQLNCTNKTSGTFQSVVWTTAAIQRGRMETAYKYDTDGKQFTDEHFGNRLTRYNGASIQIKNAKETDAGKWECNIIYRVEDWPGQQLVRTAAVYNVILISRPPVITNSSPQEFSFSTSPGTKREVFCDGKGTSPFNITWSKSDGEMDDNVKFTEWIRVKNGEYKIRKHMIFSKFSSRSVGEYVCTAQNSAGKSSKTLNIKLQVHPRITSPAYIMANVGKSILLHCNASGYPKVTFKWEFSTNNLKQQILRPAERLGRYEVMETTYRGKSALSVLKISSVQKQDWGVYYCFAENKAGFDERQIRLDGFSVPDTPTALHSEDRTSRSILLKWRLGDNGGKKVKLIKLEFKRSISNTWRSLQLSKVEEYTVRNLRPNTFYDFRISATNDVGESEPSNVYSVKTEVKVTPSSQSQKKKIVWGLDLLALVGIGAGVLIVLTCIISCSCFLYFDGKSRREAKKRRREKKKETTELNHYLIT